jgi:hypothetical protein
LLRWAAALEAIEAFPRQALDTASFLQAQADAVARGLATVAGAELVDGLSPSETGWADLPSIFTFAIRNPADRGQFLSAADLQPLYRRLAHQNILLGQPVTLGTFGGLRIAFGARDIVGDQDGPPVVAPPLPHVFDVLRGLVSDAATGMI